MDQIHFGSLLKWSLISIVTLAAVLIAMFVLFLTQRKDIAYNNPYFYGEGQYLSFHYGILPLFLISGIVLLIIAKFFFRRWLVWHNNKPNYYYAKTFFGIMPIRIIQERY